MLEVKDGGNAQAAYLEANALEGVSPRKRAIEAALRAYCERDTWAMVAIHRGLMGLSHAASTN
jgi:predicted transcriptional regulator